jgi:ribonuclease P protein component
VLPEPYRLHHRADFSRTVRRGQRVGRRDLVVHVLLPDEPRGVAVPEDLSDRIHPDRPAARIGGPRFGLIVSKAVGTAVVRHRVARRLRHICAGLVADLPPAVDIVIRALPGAADAPSAELDRQLRAAFRKLLPESSRTVRLDPGIRQDDATGKDAGVSGEGRRRERSVTTQAPAHARKDTA